MPGRILSVSMSRMPVLTTPARRIPSICSGVLMSSRVGTTFPRSCASRMMRSISVSAMPSGTAHTFFFLLFMAQRYKKRPRPAQQFTCFSTNNPNHPFFVTIRPTTTITPIIYMYALRSTLQPQNLQAKRPYTTTAATASSEAYCCCCHNRRKAALTVPQVL